jgi:hypothetical protein
VRLVGGQTLFQFLQHDPHEDDHLMRSRMSEFCVKDDGRLLGVTRQDLLTYVRNRLALTT